MAASGGQREPAEEPADHQAAIDRVRPPAFDHPEENAEDTEARDKPEKTTGTDQANLKCIAGCHRRQADEENNWPTKAPAYDGNIDVGIGLQRPL